MNFYIPLKKYLLVGCAILLFNSCAVTYNDKTADIQNSLISSNFDQATAQVDNNKFLQKKRNRLLYLLEKGKLEHLNGNYESSNKYFEEAYILIDDHIKTSAGQAIAANLTNPMAAPYKGEDFEKVTVHYYKALNFFQLGQPDAALVEAKRINIKLQELNDRYKKNKNKYTEDAFSQILQGILYEATGDVNNAFIAYRNAAELYEANKGQYFGVPLPEQLQRDLLRTSKRMGFQDEYSRYKKEFKITETNYSADAEAIIFWENGLGPVKDQTTITAAGGGGGFFGSYDGESIYIPIPPGVNIGISAIAIPKYMQRESFYRSASILYDDKEVKLELAEDFFPIARQCLKDRMLREVIDIAIRFGTKKAASKGIGLLAKELGGDLVGEVAEFGADIAGAATEKADTRNWQTLPATISYARVPLKSNEENIFIIKKLGPNAVVDYDTLHVPFKKGLQIVNYSDLGRATSSFIEPPVALMRDASEDSAPSGGPLAAANAPAGAAAEFKDISIEKSAPAGMTVKTVYAKYLDAIGGSKEVEKLNSLTQTTTTSAAGTTTTTTTTITKDGKVYSKSNSGSYSSEVFFDGNNGYTLIGGKKTPFTEDMAKMYRNMKIFPELKPDGSEELMGITTVEGEEAYVVSSVQHGIPTKTLYSLNSGLKIMSVTSATYNGVTSNGIFKMLDYRDVQGLKFPHKMLTTTYTGEHVFSAETQYGYKINEGIGGGDGKMAASQESQEQVMAERPANGKISRILKANEELETNNSATIYIIRKGKLAGSAVKLPVFCNDVYECKITSRRYEILKATPGKLLIQSKPQGMMAFESDPFELDIEAGQTYYVFVETRLYSTTVDYSMLSELEANEYLSKYKQNK